MSPMFPSSGFDILFSIFPFLFLTIFLIIVGVIVASIVASAKKNAYNRRQPILTVSARVLTRRTDVSHHHDANDNMHSSHTTTTHYATFEVESGDRLEFTLPGKEYGLLLEGDYGKLTFQGTRYLGFVRDPQAQASTQVQV